MKRKPKIGGPYPTSATVTLRTKGYPPQTIRMQLDKTLVNRETDDRISVMLTGWLNGSLADKKS